MIRALIALVASLALACCTASRKVPAEAAPALWEVANGRDQPVGWLFGTIHALPADTAWETPAIARTIAGSGILLVEIRDLDPDRTGAMLSRLAHDTPGPPLAQRLPPAQRPTLAALLAETGTSARALDGLETWAAALAIGRLGREATSGTSVDSALVERFASRPVAELEGAEDQLAIFDRMPERDQRALLSAVLAERDDPMATPEVLARAWLTGDLRQLEALTRRGLLSDPALYRVLAAERNRAWAARIAPLLTAGRKPLVAVGAAHMLGPEGLPALLAARGYTVRRIQ